MPPPKSPLSPPATTSSSSPLRTDIPHQPDTQTPPPTTPTTTTTSQPNTPTAPTIIPSHPTRPPLSTRHTVLPTTNLDQTFSRLSLRPTISNPQDLSTALTTLSLRSRDSTGEDDPENERRAAGREESYPGLGDVLNPAFGESLEVLRKSTVNRGACQEELDIRRRLASAGSWRRRWG